jgi:hypothetical protein
MCPLAVKTVWVGSAICVQVVHIGAVTASSFTLASQFGVTVGIATVAHHRIGNVGPGFYSQWSYFDVFRDASAIDGEYYGWSIHSGAVYELGDAASCNYPFTL